MLGHQRHDSAAGDRAARPVLGFLPEYAALSRSGYGGDTRVSGDLPTWEGAGSRAQCHASLFNVDAISIALFITTAMSIAVLVPATLTSEWEVCTADVRDMPGVQVPNSTSSVRASLGLTMRCTRIKGALPIGCEARGEQCRSCTYPVSLIIDEARRNSDVVAGFAVDAPTMQRLALPRWIMYLCIITHVCAVLGELKLAYAPLSGDTSIGARCLRRTRCLHTRAACPASGHAAAVSLGVATLVVWFTYVGDDGTPDTLPYHHHHHHHQHPGTIARSSLVSCGWGWGVGAVFLSTGMQLFVVAPLAALLAVLRRRHGARSRRGGAEGKLALLCCRGSLLRGAVASGDLGAARNVSALAAALDDRPGDGVGIS